MESIRFDDIDPLKRKITNAFGPFGPEIEITPVTYVTVTPYHPAMT